MGLDVVGGSGAILGIVVGKVGGFGGQGKGISGSVIAWVWRGPTDGASEHPDDPPGLFGNSGYGGRGFSGFGRAGRGGMEQTVGWECTHTDTDGSNIVPVPQLNSVSLLCPQRFTVQLWLNTISSVLNI